MSAAYGTGPALVLSVLDELQPHSTEEVAQATGLTVGHTSSVLRGLKRDGSVRVSSVPVKYVSSAGRRMSTRRYLWLRVPGASARVHAGHRMDLTLDLVLASMSPEGDTASEIADRVQASPHQIGQALRSLRSLGRVEVAGHRAIIQHGRTVKHPLWHVLQEERPALPPRPRRDHHRNRSLVYETEIQIGQRRLLLVVEDVLCSIREWDPIEGCWMALAHGTVQDERPVLTASGWYEDTPDADAIIDAAAEAMPRLKRSRTLNEHEVHDADDQRVRAMSDTLRQDLEILRQHGPAQVPALAQKSGRTTGALWCSMNALKALGLVERQGTPGVAIFAAIDKEAA